MIMKSWCKSLYLGEAKRIAQTIDESSYRVAAIGSKRRAAIGSIQRVKNEIATHIQGVVDREVFWSSVRIEPCLIVGFAGAKVNRNA